MSIGTWYRALLERFVTHEVYNNGFSFAIRPKTENQNRNINWESIWPLCTLPGLDSTDSSFLFCLLHNLLPTQERLHRVLSHTVATADYTLCTQNVVCDKLHALIFCPYNNGTGYWIIRSLRTLLPLLQPAQLISLNFGLNSSDENALPATWLAAKALNMVWLSRVNKKVTTIAATRAALEAGVMLLRKSRYNQNTTTLENLIAVD